MLTPVLFGVLPGPAKVLAMFLNGLPLGMVWGVLVGDLEGRRATEMLLAMLSCSYILASGWVESLGAEVLDTWGVGENGMPAVVGLVVLPVSVSAVGMLHALPPPDERDVAERSRRVPVDGKSRGAFLRRFLPGLALLLVMDFVLTADRDYRDNFASVLSCKFVYKRPRPAGG